MKVNRRFLVKTYITLALFAYLVVTKEYNTMNLDATISLVISFVWMRRFKDTNLLFIMTLFITYSIYSIVMGEYYFKSSLGVPMTQVNTEDIYAMLIRILTIYIFILAVFINVPPYRFVKMKYNNNAVLYFILLMILILIGLFGVDRSIGTSYTVNTTAIYEYSSILFLFAYYSSGNNRRKKIIVSVILLGFVLQDFYLGGRITALQLIIVFSFCMIDELLNTKRILYGSVIGIVVNSLVGAYRSSYSLDGLSITNLVKNLLDNRFVFDTATYSYYASGTHVASVTSGKATSSIRLMSFIEFAKSIVFGGGDNLGNVTRFVNDNFFRNIGGGIMPTHFYFWFGWAGVIISAMSIVILVNKMMKKNSDFTILSLTIVAITAPRWFLYNPLLLYRAQFIMGILYLLYMLGNTIILKIAGAKK